MYERDTADRRIVILGKAGKVVPAALIVGQGESVIFEAVDTRVDITFHDDTSPFDVRSLRIEAEKVSEPHKVTGTPRVYPYSAWCIGNPGHSAQGGSDPIIIIKRPSRS